MSFWGTVGRWMWGIDVDAEQRRAEELDKKIAEQNALAKQRGLWTDEEYQAAEARREAMLSSGDYSVDLSSDFWAGAREGWGDTLQTATGLVRGTLNTAAEVVWRAVPWWVWVLGLAYLAWSLGWLSFLRKR